MLVSIIITNFNYGRFLKDAIDSALGQTYAGVEVIVVDDGSTDHSLDVIRSYGDRVTPIFKANGGQPSAINMAFARCLGEVIIFLDSDDVLLPGVVQQVVDAFCAHPDAAKVQYRMEVINAVGQRMHVLKPAVHMPLLSGDLSRNILAFPGDVPWLPTSGNAFSRRVLQQILPVPEEAVRHIPDMYLCNVSPLFGPVVSLQEVGAFYRMHGANNHEVESLSLPQIRRLITHWRATYGYIYAFAVQLGLEGRPRTVRDVLSVCDTAHRMISLKLEPDQHPIAEDRMWGLFVLGMMAIRRRFDVVWLMKVLYVFWFSAMVVAPRPLARWLTVQWLYPEKRGQLNLLLGRLHLVH